MLTRLTPLDGEAILPLEDAKASQRILHTAEDALLASFRDAAVSQVERASGVVLAEAQFLWTLPRFCARIDLPMRPVVSVDGVVYGSADGVEQAYSGARLVGGSVYPAAGGSWPAAYDYATVTFTAGMASPDLAPELIQAAKLLFGHFNVNREAVTVGPSQVNELPMAVDFLIGSHRQVMV